MNSVASNSENTKKSTFEKVPGDRQELATDVCPMVIADFVQLGDQVKSDIDSLETLLTFDDWLLQEIFDEMIPVLQ